MSALKLATVRDSICKQGFNVLVSDGKGTALMTCKSSLDFHAFLERIMCKSFGLPVHLSSAHSEKPQYTDATEYAGQVANTDHVFSPECKAKTITQREVQKPGNMAQFKCLRKAATFQKRKGGGGRKEGTKERLNCGILATLLNGSFVFHLHDVFQEHKPGLKQDLISVSLVLYGNET